VVGGGNLLQLQAGEPPKPRTPEHVQKLINLLGDKKFDVRQSATMALVKVGPDAVPALMLALKHADPEVRKRARTALDAIMKTPAYLVGAIKDPDKTVRRQALQMVEQLGDKAKAMVPQLVEALKDKDEEVREAATMALISIDPDNKALADTSAVKASVNGKYGKLLRRIYVPQDKANYTEFRDYGQYQGTDYAGHQNIPAGYWVYVYPHWYIWGEQKK
jgi:HEAT repeat protein